MQVENKEFWEKDKVIISQDIAKKSSDFEIFMMEKAKEIYANFGSIKKIKIFGCGTGREIESISEFYHPIQMVASDIAENMIIKCNDNLKLWKLEACTETLTIDAKDYNKVLEEYDLVTFFNSMMTYVIAKKTELRFL